MMRLTADYTSDFLLKRQRLPRAIVFQRQLNRPRRSLGRDRHFNPKFLTRLERGRVRRVLGNIEIHRLDDMQGIAGKTLQEIDGLEIKTLSAPSANEDSQ